ncbi:hypothetical protein Glove_307g68 [Diversispora epigaea]|uniref:HNH nuclease domain-containing protein n=1 Tax=Diversispora epigaea TaxID=1348612 RepID=A0A397HWQ4_9GLOM|nr:hypothetical protein Glove_307g68 [Diversispora epigaea]
MKCCGYILTEFKINDVYKYTSVRILVAQVFIPNSNNKPYVNYINKIKYNNQAINLEWITSKENAERSNILTCRGKQNIADGWYWIYFEDYVKPDLDEE